MNINMHSTITTSTNSTFGGNLVTTIVPIFLKNVNSQSQKKINVILQFMQKFLFILNMFKEYYVKSDFSAFNSIQWQKNSYRYI